MYYSSGGNVTYVRQEAAYDGGSASASASAALASRGLGRREHRISYYEADERKNSDFKVPPSALEFFVNCLPFRLAVCAVIVASVVLVIYETDLRAANEEIPDWLKYTSNGILLFYIAEVSIRISALSLSFFYHFENLFDISVVITDTVLEFLEHTGALDGGSVGFLRLFRALRIMRILRLAVSFPFLHELYLIMHSFVHVLRALIWATLLLGIVLIMWAIVAVDVLNPLNKDLVRDGVYPDDCFNCGQAYSSVFRAMLTNVQGIIAGDAWGQVALPIVTENPWTFGIFMMMLVTVQLGVLNLILAVVVDRAIEARQGDEEHIMNHRQLEYARIEQSLKRLCESMADGDGIITLDEVKNAFENNPAFVQAVGGLGIASQDVKALFSVLDYNNSGRIYFIDLIDKIHQLRCADVRADSMFIRHFTSKALPTQIVSLRESVLKLNAAVDRIRDTMQSMAGQMAIANSSEDGHNSHGSSKTMPGKTLPNVSRVDSRSLPQVGRVDSRLGMRTGDAIQNYGLDNRDFPIQTWQKIPESIEQSFVEFKYRVEAEFQRFISTTNNIVVQASRLPPAGFAKQTFWSGQLPVREEAGGFTPPTGVSSTLLARPPFAKTQPPLDPHACQECGFRSCKGCKALGQDDSLGLLKVCGTPMSCNEVGGVPIDRVVISNGPMPTPSPFAVD